MKFWEISDSFWEVVKPLIPETVRDPEKVYQRIAGGGRKPLDYRKVFSAIVYVLKTGTQWKSLPKEFYGSPAPSTPTSKNGKLRDCSASSGRKALQNLKK